MIAIAFFFVRVLCDCFKSRRRLEAAAARQHDPRSIAAKVTRVEPRKYLAIHARQLALEAAKTAEAVALEIVDTEVRWLANPRATTVIGLKLKASYASTEGNSPTASSKTSCIFKNGRIRPGNAIAGDEVLKDAEDGGGH